MKKLIIALVSVASFSSSVFAQTLSPCTDLPSSLSKGMENKNVLALQNFLYAQGYLKATPNGYFGPGTFAAVKALQKSLGFAQVGTAGPATRGYIKTATCQTGTSPQTTPAGNQATTTPQPISQPGVSPVLPKPELDSIDLVSIFAGGETDWGFDLHGFNFSSTTNTVYFKNLGNNMIYTIGTFGSAIGTAITLPQSIGNTKFSCGTNCSQTLSPGAYEISVQTPSGQTVGKFIEVRPFTLQAKTGSEIVPIPANATSVRIGTLTFSAPVPVIVRSVSFAISTSTPSTISPNGIGAASYTDVMRGDAVALNTELSALQTMIVDAMVSTSNTFPGTLMGFFTVTVEDYIGKRSTTFTSPQFLVTVAGTI